MVTDVADENGTLELMQYPFVATDCIPERQQAGCSSIENRAEEQSFMLTGGTQARRSAWAGEGICNRSAGALRGSLAGATRNSVKACHASRGDRPAPAAPSDP